MGKTRRVRAYIDGFNFYYGLRSLGWKKYYWLDLPAYMDSFMYDGMQLDSVTYFTAKPFDKPKRNRQHALFKANQLDDRFKVKYGSYAREPHPEKPNDPKSGWLEEKKTDVNLSIAMIDDVHFDRCDVTFLVTADTDQAPTLQHIQSLKPDHQVFVLFPSNRFNNELKQLARACYRVEDYEKRLADNLLPVEVELRNGNKLSCPVDWLAHYPATGDGKAAQNGAPAMVPNIGAASGDGKEGISG